MMWYIYLDKYCNYINGYFHDLSLRSYFCLSLAKSRICLLIRTLLLLCFFYLVSIKLFFPKKNKQNLIKKTLFSIFIYSFEWFYLLFYYDKHIYFKCDSLKRLINSTKYEFRLYLCACGMIYLFWARPF